LSQFTDLQKLQFNRSLVTVTETNKKLAKVYIDGKKKVLNRINSYKELWKKSQIIGLSNAETLYRELDSIVLQITTQRQSLIYQSATMTSEETYNLLAYGYERQVNIDTQFLNAGNNQRWRLSIPVIPKDAIEATLTNNIAGYTFSDREIKEVRFLQDQLRNELASSIAAGDSIANVSKIISDKFDWSRARATTTARTEILRAYSYQQEAVRKEAILSGIEIISFWDSTLDGDTRQDHKLMDGIEADIIEDMPLFTRDTSLPADQSINCRCRRIDIPKGFIPTERGNRVDGKWTKTDDITYTEWVNNR
jgi:hypothetical protein